METDTGDHIKYSFHMTAEKFTVSIVNTIDAAAPQLIVVANTIGAQPLEQTAFDLK